METDVRPRWYMWQFRSIVLLHGPVFPEKRPLKWCNTSARPNPAYFFFLVGRVGGREVNKRSTWRPYPHFSRRLPLPRHKSSTQKDAAGTLISLHSDFRNRGLSGCRDCELEFAHHRSLSEKQKNKRSNNFIQINQPTRCVNLSDLLLVVQIQLNMFWGSSCPLSGAYKLQLLPVVYCWNVVLAVLLVVVGGQEDARNMLSCIWTTSNKSERLMHLVCWFIWMYDDARTYKP